MAKLYETDAVFLCHYYAVTHKLIHEAISTIIMCTQSCNFCIKNYELHDITKHINWHIYVLTAAHHGSLPEPDEFSPYRPSVSHYDPF